MSNATPAVTQRATINGLDGKNKKLKTISPANAAVENATRGLSLHLPTIQAIFRKPKAMTTKNTASATATTPRMPYSR
jgi:hypothetical protein